VDSGQVLRPDGGKPPPPRRMCPQDTHPSLQTREPPHHHVPPCRGPGGDDSVGGGPELTGMRPPLTLCECVCVCVRVCVLWCLRVRVGCAREVLSLSLIKPSSSSCARGRKNPFLSPLSSPARVSSAMKRRTAQYKAKCIRSGPRDDGLTIKELVTSFRKQLYLNIQMELANGVGLTINQSGLYRTGH